MTVTLHDIARLAGVNAGSVSRVLGKHPHALNFRPATRRRIIAAARKLGYRRNELAATMRTGTNRTVAVILRFEELLGAVSTDSMIIAGILKEATRLDYEVKIYADTELAAGFNAILGHRISYVLSMSIARPRRERTAAFCRKHKLKLVFIYEQAHDEFPSVTTADRESMRQAVLYLAKLGHGRIALVCGSHQFHYVKERHAGYLQGLAEAGLRPDPAWLACGIDRNIVRRLEALLARPAPSRPTAFLCAADSWAMLVQRAAVRKQMQVPGDVSVIGFGDSDLAKMAVVPLSSIAQPFGKMGATALRLLLNQPCQSAPAADGSCLLPNKLIVRESVGPLRQAPAPEQAAGLKIQHERMGRK